MKEKHTTIVESNMAKRQREIQEGLIKHLSNVELAIQQAKQETAREIFEAYDDYIKLLGEEIDGLSGLAISHGWRSSKFEAGEKCRAKIQSLKSQYLPKKGIDLDKLMQHIEVHQVLKNINSPKEEK